MTALPRTTRFFIVTADEGDHFVGGPPTPANCDGIHTPCTYGKIGEINTNLAGMLATERSNTTSFTVHSDDAPTVYINGNPSQTAPQTRKLEQESEKVITYLNNEVVPAIRNQSSKALRVAADKLSKLAEYMDQHRSK